MESPFRRPLAPDFELFETMGYHPGEGVRFERLHLDRLCASARVFGLAFDRTALSGQIAAACAGQGPLRVRLALDRTGKPTLLAVGLPPAPGRWRVGLAKTRVTAGDFWRGHKTSHRQIYNDARAALPEGVDEVIFLNDRGGLAEGTITNLFLDPGDGPLLTPPLSAGVLPGILRRHLIETGRARVAPLTLADLHGAKAVFMGNALRGLIPATLDIPRPA